MQLIFNNVLYIHLYSFIIITNPQKSLEICDLSNDIMDYHIVSQGKTTIPSVDDAEELGLTDVRIFIVSKFT
jgi:myosin heavy chain 6/7